MANFRRSLEGDFRAFFAGENRQKHFHLNFTANFTIKLHYEVLGCGGHHQFVSRWTFATKFASDCECNGVVHSGGHPLPFRGCDALGCRRLQPSWHQRLDRQMGQEVPLSTGVAIGPAPHRLSRALRARNPGRVRKESLLDSFRTLLRLRGALFRHFWGPAPGYSFRTLFGLFPGSGPEGPGRPCVGRGQSQDRRLYTYMMQDGRAAIAPRDLQGACLPSSCTLLHAWP